MKRKEKEAIKNGHVKVNGANKAGQNDQDKTIKKGNGTGSDYVTKPKKALSTWLIFNTETVAKLREKGLEHRDAFQKSAEIWKKLSDKQKEPYVQKQKLDQQRYEK